MPLILLTGGPRAGETFRSDDLHVRDYAVQSFDGPCEAVRYDDADVMVMVHESIKGVDSRMAAAHADWQAARDAGRSSTNKTYVALDLGRERSPDGSPTP